MSRAATAPDGAAYIEAVYVNAVYIDDRKVSSTTDGVILVSYVISEPSVAGGKSIVDRFVYQGEHDRLIQLTTAREQAGHMADQLKIPLVDRVEPKKAPPTPAGAVYVDDSWGSKDVSSAIVVAYSRPTAGEAVTRALFEYDDSAERVDQVANARRYAEILADELNLPVIDRCDLALPCACSVNDGQRAKRRTRP